MFLNKKNMKCGKRPNHTKNTLYSETRQTMPNISTRTQKGTAWPYKSRSLKIRRVYSPPLLSHFLFEVSANKPNCNWTICFFKKV